MSDSPNSIDRASRITPAPALAQHRRERPPVDEPVTAPVDAATFDGVSATVPDEVLAEIGDAMDRLDDLHAEGRSVRVTPAGGNGPRIELVDADGSGRDVAPTELFGIVAGERDASAASSAPVTGHVDREA